MRITYPNYSTVTLDLSQAGSYELAQAGQRLQIVHATNGADVAPQARIWVSLGQQSEDGIPLSMGGIIAGRVERYYVRWDAQPGCKVWVLVSQSGDAEGGILVQTPPTASLTVQDGSAWQVTDSGTVAALSSMAATLDSSAMDRVGTSKANGASATRNTFVTAAANTNGVILRSVSMGAATGIYVGAIPSSLSSGGLVLGTYDNYAMPHWVGALYVPAGNNITVWGSANAYSVTWDML